jgi:hypothetical protein
MCMYTCFADFELVKKVSGRASDWELHCFLCGRTSLQEELATAGLSFGEVCILNCKL